MQRQGLVGVTAQLAGIDLLVREGPGEQVRVVIEMRFEQVDAATMHRQRRRVGKIDTPLGDEVEAAMFPSGLRP